MSNRRSLQNRNKARRQKLDKSDRDAQNRQAIGRNNARQQNLRARTGPANSTIASQLRPGDMSTLRPESVRNWNQDNVRAVGNNIHHLSNRTFHSLPPQAIEALSPKQLKDLTRNKLSGLTADQFARLNVRELGDIAFSYLDPTNHIAKLSPNQVQAIRPEQMANIRPSQLNQLAPQRLTQLRTEAFASIPSQTFNSLSQAQITALTNEQLQAISAEQVQQLSEETFNKLAPEQLAQLAPETIANIPHEAFNSISQNLLDAITNDQANSLSEEQLGAIANAMHPGTAPNDLNTFNQLANNNNRADLFRLLRNIGNRSSLTETTDLITQAIHHNDNTSLSQINNLLNAAPDGGNPAASLRNLIDSIGDRNTVDETRELIERAIHHNDDTTIGQIYELVNAAPDGGTPATDLRTLLDSVEDRNTVDETRELIERAIHHNDDTAIDQLNNLVNAAPDGGTPATDLKDLLDSIEDRNTVDETRELIERAIHHNDDTTIDQLNNLVNAAPDGGTPATDLRDLLDSVGDRNTVDETRGLIERAIHHNNATTIDQLNNLLQAAGNNHPNVSVDLRNLVDAVQHHGTVPQISNMVQTARGRIGPGHTADLIPLINRGAAQNTPARVNALLNGLHGNTNNVRRARFNNIVGRIGFFERRAANPAPPAVAATPDNHDNLPGGVMYANQHSYRQFYERHSYSHFDFGNANHSNSMWPNGTDIRATFLADFPHAAGLVAGGGFVNTPNGQMAVNAGNRANHFRPRNGAVDMNIRQAEINAINYLA